MTDLDICTQGFIGRDHCHFGPKVLVLEAGI